MNREIKFRVFDKNSKYGSMREFGLGEVLLCDDGDTLVDFSVLPVMQFTGLKDKNGKDIYEGDFVRQGDTLYEIRGCVGGYECQIWEELKKGGAIEGSCYMFSCLSEKYCVVVGNIYENPELLNPQP